MDEGGVGGPEVRGHGRVGRDREHREARGLRRRSARLLRLRGTTDEAVDGKIERFRTHFFGRRVARARSAGHDGYMITSEEKKKMKVIVKNIVINKQTFESATAVYLCYLDSAEFSGIVAHPL